MRTSTAATTFGLALLALSALAGCASSRSQAEATVPSGWPLPRELATVSSAFGEARGRSSHQGLDIAAPPGTPVRATADGLVVFAGRFDGYGRLVVLDHGGGWETRYAHLHRIGVREGDRVRRGREIGTVGRSGNARGAHLHYEVHRRGAAIDPQPTLGW